MILENDIEKYLIKKVKALGGLTFKFTSPGTRAVPDRIVIYNGLTVFVELKAPHRNLRADQSLMGMRMINKGGAVIMINSFEKVDWLLHVLKGYTEGHCRFSTPQEMITEFLMCFGNSEAFDKWKREEGHLYESNPS